MINKYKQQIITAYHIHIKLPFLNVFFDIFLYFELTSPMEDGRLRIFRQDSSEARLTEPPSEDTTQSDLLKENAFVNEKN